MDPRVFFEAALEAGIGIFAGVPDSLLKSFCACVAELAPRDRHIIAANEGGAVAIAAGYHLGTGELPLVYLQNSGFGNAVNPLLSLADPAVYGVPMVLLVGWRGEPGTRDEPQHMKQGGVMEGLLTAMEIPFLVADAGSDPRGLLGEACRGARDRNGPFVLLVRSGAFSPFACAEVEDAPRVGETMRAGGERGPSMGDFETSGGARAPAGGEVDPSGSNRSAGASAGSRHDPFAPLLSREEAIAAVLDASEGEEAFICTTGMASRELFELRESRGEGHDRDLLTVGSMGHASQIALGLAIARPDLSVTCLDGDGALLMHMGALAIIGERRPANLRHIVLNNGAHDSVGGQPTVAPTMDLPAIALACGYRSSHTAVSRDEISASLGGAGGRSGPAFLEVQVKKGARSGLGRPTISPMEARAAFMARLGPPSEKR